MYFFRTPTVDGTENGLDWPVFTTIKDSSFLYIGSDQPTTIKNPYEEKYTFWRGLPLTSCLNTSIPINKSYVKSEL